MPKVDLDELDPKLRRHLQANTTYQKEFAEINRKKKFSPAPTSSNPVAKRKNLLLLSFLVIVVTGTYGYTVNQIAREGYLDEKLDSWHWMIFAQIESKM